MNRSLLLSAATLMLSLAIAQTGGAQANGAQASRAQAGTGTPDSVTTALSAIGLTAAGLQLNGRYSRGSALRPLKAGIGHFALQAGVPICPVTVRGTDALHPFRRIEVTIGPPIQPDPPAWWALSSRVAKIVDNVRVALTNGLRRRPPRKVPPRSAV